MIDNISDGILSFERFTNKKGAPTTWGDAIDLRIGKQSAGYKNRYPDGSVIIGSPD
jgi:hypothetical protein